MENIKGIYRDVLTDRDGNVIFDSGWKSNLIVNGCRILLAALMKNNTPGGITCLRVGIGDPAWDDLADGPPPPVETDNALTDTEHFFEIPVGDNLVLEYLYEAGEPPGDPTHRLVISAALGKDEPTPPNPALSTYPLREFGLFGVYVDEHGVSHEYMIDSIRHPVIHKDEDATLNRVIRLYF